MYVSEGLKHPGFSGKLLRLESPDDGFFEVWRGEVAFRVRWKESAGIFLLLGRRDGVGERRGWNQGWRRG